MGSEMCIRDRGVGGELSLVVAAADCTIAWPPPESLTLEFCTSLEESSAFGLVRLLTDEVAGAKDEVDVGPVQCPYALAKLVAVLPSVIGCELFCKGLN